MVQRGISRVKKLGEDLAARMHAQIATPEAFRGTFGGEDPPLDVKKLKDFVSAYHELARTITELSPEASGEKSAVILMPEVKQDE